MEFHSDKLLGQHFDGFEPPVAWLTGRFARLLSSASVDFLSKQGITTNTVRFLGGGGCPSPLISVMSGVLLPFDFVEAGM
jgi:hypothetical protein